MTNDIDKTFQKRLAKIIIIYILRGKGEPMKKITVMIVPPETTKVFKFQFSQKMFIGVVILLALVVIYTIIMIFTFSDIMYVRQKNRSLSNRYKILV